MIERIEGLPEGLCDNVFTVRIKALYNTYSQSVGINIFRQTVDGKLTAVFGGMDNSFSLYVIGDADYEELNEYFGFLGVFCFCDGDIGLKLSPKERQTATLYELDFKSGAADFPYCKGHEPMAEIYKILETGTDGDIALPPYELWYSDFCVRFNHGAAEYAVIRNAAAVSGFMTEEASLITGVAVAEPDRKKGLGTAVLGVLIHNIRAKYPKSKIFAATGTAGGFYEKLKFKKVGLVANCRF